MNTQLVIADYANEQHGNDLLFLLNEYACHPMGGGLPLNLEVTQSLISVLESIPKAFSILYYQDEKPIGLANCFMGFSTFKCRPLINIHDLYVRDKFQGLHIGQKILKKVEEVAIKRDCCKITLEVLSGNEKALGAYLKFGFKSYQLDPATGSALFWEKELNTHELNTLT